MFLWHKALGTCCFFSFFLFFIFCLICIFLLFFFSRSVKKQASIYSSYKTQQAKPNAASQLTVVHFALKQQVFFISYFFIVSLYLTWIHVCSSIFALNHILQIGRQRWISLSGDPGKIQFYDSTISPSQIHFVVARLFGLLSCKAPGQACAKVGAPVLTCRIVNQNKQHAFFGSQSVDINLAIGSVPDSEARWLRIFVEFLYLTGVCPLPKKALALKVMATWNTHCTHRAWKTTIAGFGSVCSSGCDIVA